MPARSRRAPAPPARRQVRICRAGLGQGPGAGGPGGGRQPLSHGPLRPVTKLGRTLGLRPGRRTCRQVSRPERAARAGGLPSGEGSAPPTPDPNLVSGGGGRRAGRERAEWGARRSGGPGAPSRLAPPVLLSGPGDKLRGKRGPRAGSAWRPGRLGPRAPGRCPARPRGPAPAALRPGLRCPRPGPRRAEGGQGEEKGPRRPGRGPSSRPAGAHGERPRCGSLGWGGGRRTRHFPNPMARGSFFSSVNGVSPSLLTGNAGPSVPFPSSGHRRCVSSLPASTHLLRNPGGREVLGYGSGSALEKHIALPSVSCLPL